jgi:hypothetical protein
MDRQEQLSEVRAELEKQAVELERRLGEFDARRTEFERFRADEQRRMSHARAAQSLAAATAAAQRAAAARAAGSSAETESPDEIGAFEDAEVIFPDDDSHHPKPDTIRNLLTPLDVPRQSAAAARADRLRWIFLAAAAVILLFFVAMVARMRRLSDAAVTPDSVTAGKSMVVATPPKVDDSIAKHDTIRRDIR